MVQYDTFVFRVWVKVRSVSLPPSLFLPFFSFHSTCSKARGCLNLSLIEFQFDHNIYMYISFNLPNGKPLTSIPRAATSVQIKNLTSLALNLSKLCCRSSGFRSECKHTHDNRCLFAFGPI